MYAETKRRTYLQIGVFVGALGVLLAIVGLYYVNNSNPLALNSALGLATQRAATLWGGILLVCFAVRNITLAFPATRFTSDGMWDTCAAVFANLLSLLISGAIVGITLWAHVEAEFFKSSLDTLSNSVELVNLVAILLLGVLAMLASLVGCIVACFPVSDAEAPGPGEQYAMENQGFNKH